MRGEVRIGADSILRPLKPEDLPDLRRALEEIQAFTARERRVAFSGFAAAVQGDGEERSCGVFGPGQELRGAVCYTRAPLSDHVWVITWLFVRPAWERRSLGRALVQYVEAEARTEGGTLLVVETSGRPGLAGALAFWEACGLQIEAKVADFYGPGEALIFLVKRLGGVKGGS